MATDPATAFPIDVPVDTAYIDLGDLQRFATTTQQALSKGVSDAQTAGAQAGNAAAAQAVAPAEAARDAAIAARDASQTAAASARTAARRSSFMHLGA